MNSNHPSSRRLRVALVFGGRSGEHEVSVVSATYVRDALNAAGHDVLPMAVDRAGRWADPELARKVLDSCGKAPDAVPQFHGSVSLDPRLLDGGIDAVVPILHGPYGEDGTVQGLCEVLDLPYVGCGVAACAVTMDKILTKRLLQQAGLPTPAFVALTEQEIRGAVPEVENRCHALELPVFVKPARLGSSVGISKIKGWEELPEALKRAAEFDDLVIVEQGIDAREIEVAVLGGDPPLASVPGEVVPGREFYDYIDKYLEEGCRLIAPAELGEADSNRVSELALQVFAALGCEGMARVDVLMERSSGEMLVNEVNAVPGFTSISMYPRLLELTGVPYPELLDRLIALALKRHARRRRHAEAALRPLADRAR